MSALNPSKNESAGRVAEEDPLQRELTLLARAEHNDAFSFLGPHIVERNGVGSLVARGFFPKAARITVIVPGQKAVVPAKRLSPEGIFEATLPLPPALPISAATYRWSIEEHGQPVREIFDPYAFAPLFSDFDLHLAGEGRDYCSYEKMGAHPAEIDGIAGVRFGVWAPNARRISVVGDFNQWDGRTHPMRNRGPSGIWELFIPGLHAAEIYKYEIRTKASDVPILKSDPYAFQAELRPNTGSIVADLNSHEWQDQKWMQRRATRDWLSAPISIYEVHFGSWRRVTEEGGRWLSYAEIGDQLIPYVLQLGYTHVELMPVMEHPFDGSWGYQTTGYFAATSRFGSPQEFMVLVDRFHQADIGVILDWTPAHFPTDAHGLAQFDGTHLYEHADPRQGSHPDWGTLVFNYGRNEVRNFLISNAVFWIEKYHIDGLRVDAVASMLYLDYSRPNGQWIPNKYGGRENLDAIAFLRRLNEVVYERNSGALTIAEESTSWPTVSRPTYLGGLGFSLKWNMGWMNDTLKYFEHDPIYRRYQQGNLTFSMLYAFTENFVLPLSHDEVVHGKGSLVNKMPGDEWQQFANLRLLYGYMFAHPGKKLLFMGDEFGQRSEWNHDASLDWHLLQYPLHRGVQNLVSDLNAVYKSEPALHEVDFEWRGFEWLDCTDAEASVIAFIRRAKDQTSELIVIANFTPVFRREYRVGVPQAGWYREILNTDSYRYGGSNAGNPEGVAAERVPWGNFQYSLNLALPPLAVVYFKRDS